MNPARRGPRAYSHIHAQKTKCPVVCETNTRYFGVDNKINRGFRQNDVVAQTQTKTAFFFLND